MGQLGFFDVANRYAGLDAKPDPLVKLNAMVPWEDFRPRLEGIWRRSPAEKKSKAGRKPWDAVVIFKAIVLCELYSLSDEQIEYQLRDRLSFMRFLGLGLEDRFRMRRRSGCTGSGSSRRGWSRSSSPRSTTTCGTRAGWRWAGR